MKILILCTILGLIQSSNSYALNSNAIFSGGSLPAAKEKALRENKLLILDFTAKWCLPCRHMEKTVFKNENVQKISEQHAIIFQIDIDENKSLKEEFNIEILPTIVLMKATGMIISRREESFDAVSFLAWLNTHKDLSPNEYSVSTYEQAEDAPVRIELPDLGTKTIEDDIIRLIKESSNKTSKAKKKDQTYHVQAGVFISKGNVDNMVALLKMNFQEEIIVFQEKKENFTLYKIRVGNFNNLDEAEIFRQILQKHNFKAIIRRN